MDDSMILKEVTEEEYEAEHKNSIPNHSPKQPKKQEKPSVKIPLSFLMSGNDLKISDTVFCKHPTMQEVFDIDKENLGFNSEESYLHYVSLFTSDPYDYMVYLDERGYDYEEVSPFKLFTLLFSDFMDNLNETAKLLYENGYPEQSIEFLKKNNVYYMAFKFFFNVDSIFISTDMNGNDIIVDEDGNLILDEKNYEYVYQFIRDMNGFKVPEDRVIPLDNVVKKMLIQDMKDDAEQKAMMRKIGILDEDEDSRENILGLSLSIITWMGNGITPFNRNQLHVYDVINGFSRISKEKNYDDTILGIYTRCIDPKQINIKEIHWSK